MEIFTKIVLLLASYGNISTGEAETLLSNWCDNQLLSVDREEISIEICSEYWDDNFNL